MSLSNLRTGTLSKQGSKGSLFNEVLVKDLPLPAPRSRRNSGNGSQLLALPDNAAIMEDNLEGEDEDLQSIRQHNRSRNSDDDNYSYRPNSSLSHSSSAASLSTTQGWYNSHNQTSNIGEQQQHQQHSSYSANSIQKVARPKSTLKVLIVEDNVINQKTAQKMVKMLGYETDVASNGVEAMTKLKHGLDSHSTEHPFDVILMDLHMPEMDGFQTTRVIRAMFDEPVRPTIISVTASESPEESMKCLALGMAHYIAKPIIMSELSTLLSKCRLIQPTSLSNSDANCSNSSINSANNNNNYSTPRTSSVSTRDRAKLQALPAAQLNRLSEA